MSGARAGAGRRGAGASRGRRWVGAGAGTGCGAAAGSGAAAAAPAAVHIAAGAGRGASSSLIARAAACHRMFAQAAQILQLCTQLQTEVPAAWGPMVHADLIVQLTGPVDALDTMLTTPGSVGSCSQIGRVWALRVCVSFSAGMHLIIVREMCLGGDAGDALGRGVTRTESSTGPVMAVICCRQSQATRATQPDDETCTQQQSVPSQHQTALVHQSPPQRAVS